MYSTIQITDATLIGKGKLFFQYCESTLEIFFQPSSTLVLDLGQNYSFVSGSSIALAGLLVINSSRISEKIVPGMSIPLISALNVSGNFSNFTITDTPKCTKPSLVSVEENFQTTIYFVFMLDEACSDTTGKSVNFTWQLIVEICAGVLGFIILVVIIILSVPQLRKHCMPFRDRKNLLVD